MSISSQIYQSRVQLFQHNLAPNQLAIISYPAEIQYLSGFDQFLLPYQREAILLCSKSSLILLHPHFLTLPKLNFIEYQTGTQPNQIEKAVHQLVAGQAVTEILIDPTSMYVEEKVIIDRVSVKTSLLKTRLLTQARMIKDNTEVNLMRKAAQITQKVVNQVITNLQPGNTERAIATKIDRLFVDNKAGGGAFPTIVAIGDHTALPHHQPGDRSLTPNQPILIDCGCRYHGYCSDLTRTLWFGDEPDAVFVKVKHTVSQAYQVGLELMKRQLQVGQPTVARELDHVCREHISLAGYKDNFIHTSGHSLGLEIHELPSISSNSDQELKPNMTITLEPGIYLPGKFGCRYENTLLISDHTVEELTN